MKNDPKVFIEMYKEGLKFIPRDVNVTKDSKILIQLDIPSSNKAIDNHSTKAIVEDIVVDSVSIDDDTSTTIVDDINSDSV